MHAIEVVLDALREAGVEAFLAYGTLLGAVREGKLLGHDSDADLGYVSRAHPPGRRDPRVVPDPAGARRAGLPDHPLLRPGLQGRRRRGRRCGPRPGRLRRVLDGRQPAPDGRDPRAVRGGVDLPARHHHARGPDLPGAGGHRPAADRDVRPLAGAGPGFQVRDRRVDPPPAQRLVPRAPGRPREVGPHLLPAPARGAGDPTPFVAWAAEREPGVRTIVDIGCGRGSDVLWMARRGVPAVGLDFQPRSLREAADLDVARDRVLDLQPARAARRPPRRRRTVPT